MTYRMTVMITSLKSTIIWKSCVSGWLCKYLFSAKPKNNAKTIIWIIDPWVSESKIFFGTKFKIVSVIEISCALIEASWKPVILTPYPGLKMTAIRTPHKAAAKEEIPKTAIVLPPRLVNSFGLILPTAWTICPKIKIGIAICISRKKTSPTIFK